MVCVRVGRGLAAWWDADANMNQISAVSCRLCLTAPDPPDSWLGLMNCCHPFSIPGHFNCILCFPLWLDPRHFLNYFLAPDCTVAVADVDVEIYLCLMLARYVLSSHVVASMRVIHTMLAQFRFSIFATVHNQCLLHFLRSIPQF